MNKESKELINKFSLIPHPEGGYFKENYTSNFKKDKRPICGSIYFLLDSKDISHFHQIDCDEIWYFHEGSGLKLIILNKENKKEVYLNKESPMVVIQANTIFAAENINKKSYTFISCVTNPKFTYNTFKLIYKDEIEKKYPKIKKDLLKFAYKKP